jgi:hypothetical protein
MPNINLNIQPNGPVLAVSIGVSLPCAAALTAASRPLPPTSQGTFLIDRHLIEVMPIITTHLGSLGVDGLLEGTYSTTAF